MLIAIARVCAPPPRITSNRTRKNPESIPAGTKYTAGADELAPGGDEAAPNACREVPL